MDEGIFELIKNYIDKHEIYPEEYNSEFIFECMDEEDDLQEAAKELVCNLINIVLDDKFNK